MVQIIWRKGGPVAGIAEYDDDDHLLTARHYQQHREQSAGHAPAVVLQRPRRTPSLTPWAVAGRRF